MLIIKENETIDLGLCLVAMISYYQRKQANLFGLIHFCLFLVAMATIESGNKT